MLRNSSLTFVFVALTAPAWTGAALADTSLDEQTDSWGHGYIRDAWYNKNGFTFSLDEAFRRDELRWDIADTDGTPNVLSELEWKNVNIVSVRGRVTFMYKQFALLAEGEYGWVQSGGVQDSDYDGNDRTAEFSRSESSASGEVADGNAAIGWRGFFWDSAVGRAATILPLLGYAFHRQYFAIQEGVQVVDTVSNDLGPIPGLNSSYDTSWEGPWAGLWLQMPYSYRWSVELTGDYHWKTDYSADANWNLRANLGHPLSFQHSAEGMGYRTRIGLAYRFHPSANIFMRYQYARFFASGGTDTTFDSSGQIDATTRLNKVQWVSRGVSLGVAIEF